MLRFTFIILGLIMSVSQAFSQGKVTIEGYVYEENDRGFLGGAEVKLFTSQMISVSKVITDEYGHFVFETTDDRQYIIRANKRLYFQNEQKVNPADKNEANKIFLKVEMVREPGYIFDVTLAEPRPAPDAPTNSVDGATIEIYNNTTKKMEWVSAEHPSPYFKFTFQQGNHYTIMISKERYITKQIEAYVNVHGCIVCIEGVDNVKPGVVDNLTQGHQKGTLLANIELRPIKIGEKIPIDNLYYDTGRYKVTKSMHKTLDELIVLMENNPSLIVDLRSHTDCKGETKTNRSLSLKRANAAVKYILSHSNVDEFRIKGKGMGEANPVKKCKDCRHCPNSILAQNRRTELVITGLLAQKEIEKLPLTKKVEAIHMEELLAEVLGAEQIQIPAGGEMPEELKQQIEKDNQPNEPPHVDPVKVEHDAAPKQQEVVNAVENVGSVTPRKEGVPVKKKAKKTKHKKAKKTKHKKVKEPKHKTAKVKKKVVATHKVRPAKSKTAAQVQKAKELAEAEKRAAEAFKGKPSVVQDPGISDVEEGFFDYDNESEPEVVHPRDPNQKIVTQVNLSDMDISRKVAILPSDFTGYKIELKRTRYELPMSDVIFTSYLDVVLFRNANGDYVYLTGDFGTRAVAEVGWEYVRKEMPRAKLHLFRYGKMVD